MKGMGRMLLLLFLLLLLLLLLLRAGGGDRPTWKKGAETSFFMVQNFFLFPLHFFLAVASPLESNQKGRESREETAKKDQIS